MSLKLALNLLIIILLASPTFGTGILVRFERIKALRWTLSAFLGSLVYANRCLSMGSKYQPAQLKSILGADPVARSTWTTTSAIFRQLIQ